MSTTLHEAPLPAGLGLQPDPDLRRLDAGRVLLGGSPTRLIRLGRGGARLVEGWCAGEPVPDRESARRLARRLVDAGILHPRPEGGAVQREVTVVIPVRDRTEQLAHCLDALGPDSAAVVVDDGSADPSAVARVVAQAGAHCVRRPVSGGPAAARNTGLGATITPFVAFLDSDCVPHPSWLAALLPHFVDPLVGAVAPRIRAHGEARSWLASYEQARSALDMGERASIVRPKASVPYVPSAALVVRRTAAGSGFDERLTVGEDVDFVWRMAAGGWRVRYDPAATVGHEHRVRPREWFGRRVAYGTSAAPLSRRHPGTLPAVSMSGWSVAAWVLLAAGRPMCGLGLAGAVTGVLARRLSPSTAQAWPIAFRLAGIGTLRGGEALARTVARAWWPAALPAAMASRRLRWRLVAALLAPALLDWARQRPGVPAPGYVPVRVLDDLAYSIGVWAGCARHRTAAPLLPDIWWRSSGGKPS